MQFNSPQALLLIPDRDDAQHFLRLFKARHFKVKNAQSISDAKQWLDTNVPDLALISLDSPDGDSLELLAHERLHAHAEVVLTSARENIERVRKGISSGASYFFHYPSDERFLIALIDDLAGEISPQPQSSQNTLSKVTPIDQFGLLKGRSKPMRDLYRALRRIAPKDISIFLHGESGTGKELAAKTITMFSQRSHKPFIAINCGAIPKDLIESQLFGHEKGSFSGADKKHSGYFDNADGGTLFLDEITEMPADLQVKLLRVLESGHYRPVGAESDKCSDVRVLAASNRNPEEAVATGILREDLYYRLAGFPIELPPLRNRGEDVVGLIKYFLSVFNDENGTSKQISVDALNLLKAHHWPGNVRELQSVINQAYIMANEQISADVLPVLDNPSQGNPNEHRQGSHNDNTYLHLKPGSTLQEVEKKYILKSLEEYRGNKAACAEALGISLKTLYNRLNAYAKEASSGNQESHSNSD